MTCSSYWLETCNLDVLITFHSVQLPNKWGGGCTSILTVTGTSRWGWKPDPVSNRSAHKKIHPVTIYLTKNFHISCERGGESFAIERWFKIRWYTTDGLSICCVSSYIHKNLLRSARTVAGAWHCGLGTRLGSNPALYKNCCQNLQYFTGNSAAQ